MDGFMNFCSLDFGFSKEFKYSGTSFNNRRHSHDNKEISKSKPDDLRLKKIRKVYLKHRKENKNSINFETSSA